MRIISGKYKGKPLFSPINNDVRPTTDRIKETIFNIIQFQIENSLCLDLFAGSGALGIECISRNAKEVFFVDNNKNSIELVHQNLRGVDGKYKVLNCDYYSALRSCIAQKLKFDLIFIDPPYKTLLGEDALKLILENNLLSDNGLVIFEHGSDKSYTISNNDYKQRTKTMGSVTVEFVSKKSKALFTGSFDPFTKGHLAVIEDIYDDYDEIIVALLVNPEKKYMFNPENRLEIARLSCSVFERVKCIYSEKNAVDVAKDVNANIIIRSFRNDSDFNYETEMANYNKQFGYETRLLEINKFKDISSTNCRNEIVNNIFSSLCSNAINYVKNCIDK